jgi:hypothetical protein
MRKILASKLRSAIFVAARQVGRVPTAPKIEGLIRDQDAELFRQWQEASPEPATRLQFVRRVLNPDQSREGRPLAGQVSVWPIGPRQRWDLEVAHGRFHGPAPENLARELFLHNYGDVPVDDVVSEYEGGMGEYVPRISRGESVLLGWPAEEDLDFAESDPPSHDRFLGFTVTFSKGRKRQKLVGTLYVRRDHFPWLFVQHGGTDTLDRAGEIR